MVSGGSMLDFSHTPGFYPNVWVEQHQHLATRCQRDHCLQVHNSDPHVVPGILQLFTLHTAAPLRYDGAVRLHFLHHSRKPSRKTGQHCAKQVWRLSEERETARRISLPRLGTVCHLVASSPLDEHYQSLRDGRRRTRKSLLHWHSAIPCKLCRQPSCVCV